jgi:hypothetical protein
MEESTAETTAAATLLPRIPVWRLKPPPAVLSLAGLPPADGVTA